MDKELDKISEEDEFEEDLDSLDLDD